jgi:hypothetical protein
MGIFNLGLQKCFAINNAHQKVITGMTMVGEDKIISVSHDGKIKVWTFVPAKTEFELQNELTNLLLSKLPNQNCLFNFCKVFFV